jgi:peptidyl-prolyl cis-trans isomerase C
MSPRLSLVIALCLFLPGLSACSPAADSKGGEASVSGSASPAAGEPEAQVVGTVNGRPLYKTFYDQNLSYIESRLSKDSASANVERYLNARFEAFDMLVQDELLSEEAQREGVAVTDEEVQAELKKSSDASGGESIFLASMRARGLGRSQVLDGIRRKLTVDRFVQTRIAPSLTASDDEAVAYYNAHLDRFTPEAWVKASHIFVSCPANADEDRVRRARQHAEKILQAIRAGASFEEMAREHSEDVTASVGGSLGRMKRGYAPEAFDKVAFTIPPGQVSDVVRTDKGFHIIKVADRFGGTPRPYNEVADVCRKNVLNQKQAAAIQGLVSRLQGQADIVSNLP